MRPVLQKPLLYRSVNTRTHGVRHGSCSACRYKRHSKKAQRALSTRGSMHSHHQHGLDYPPLFRFLLSKVGHQWDNVFSEANARLDRPDPVFWMVALHESDKRDYVVLDENSYYSGLCVGASPLFPHHSPIYTDIRF